MWGDLLNLIPHELKAEGVIFRVRPSTIPHEALEALESRGNPHTVALAGALAVENPWETMRAAVWRIPRLPHEAHNRPRIHDLLPLALSP